MISLTSTVHDILLIYIAKPYFCEFTLLFLNKYTAIIKINTSSISTTIQPNTAPIIIPILFVSLFLVVKFLVMIPLELFAKNRIIQNLLASYYMYMQVTSYHNWDKILHVD